MNPNDLLKNSVVDNQQPNFSLDQTFANLNDALTRNTQATANLESTDQPYAYAQALRNQPLPTPDSSTGYISPLMVLGDIIGKSTGRRDVRNLEAERKGYMDTIAETKNKQTQFDNYLNYNKERRALAKEDRDIEDHTRGRYDEDTATFTDGKNNITARFDKDQGTWVDTNGDPLDLNSWTEVEASGYGGKTLNSKDLVALSNDSHMAGTLRKLKGEFKPEYAQLSGLPTSILNGIVQGLERQDLLEMAADEELTKDAREAIIWWSNFNREFSLIERHALFGATLTNNELASWKEALALEKGMDPDLITSQLDNISGLMDEKFIRKLNALKASRRGQNDEDAIIKAAEGVYSFNNDTGGFEVFTEPTIPEPSSDEITTWVSSIDDPKVKKIVEGYPLEKQIQLYNQQIKKGGK
tara:strand:+ start:12194 stop:13432 length:1239 start_codon:yes stop_codon:yes gene_type:complete